MRHDRIHCGEVLAQILVSQGVQIALRPLRCLSQPQGSTRQRRVRIRLPAIPLLIRGTHPNHAPSIGWNSRLIRVIPPRRQG